MASHSELQSLVGQLLPRLTAEIGATQDEVRRAFDRLGRVPPALLQNGAKVAMEAARVSLDTANDHIVTCLRMLYEQYPNPRDEG